jgi:hypothetical protein
MQMYEALEQRVRSLCNYLFYASIKLVSVNLKVYGINFSENNMLLADLSLSHILRLHFYSAYLHVDMIKFALLQVLYAYLITY